MEQEVILSVKNVYMKNFLYILLTSAEKSVYNITCVIRK